MSHHGGVARKIAKILSRFPVIKQYSKFFYSRVAYVLTRKRKTCSNGNFINRINGDDTEAFFGYYDKSPANGAGLVLCCMTQQATKQVPSASETIELGVFRDEQLVFKVRINAYNWQQGCRAHWLNDDEFVFNDFEQSSQRYISRVFSVFKRAEVKKFPLPVQDSFKSKYFVSLNYQRLMALRPDYGYRNLPILTDGELSDIENDGIWSVDYGTGESRLLVSISDACKLKEADFKGALHKFNHVIISPHGDKLIFMHRFYNGGRRFDRLVLFDVISSEISLLSDFGMVSHCFWCDNNIVIGYMRGPNEVDAYWLIDIETKEFSRLPGNALQGYGDGHPHVFGDWLVTDTYPDKARMQHLMMCNWKTGEVVKLGEFFHGFDFEGECRCDLHPRFSPDGNRVFFDSVFTGQRQLYCMDVPALC